MTGAVRASAQTKRRVNATADALKARVSGEPSTMSKPWMPPSTSAYVTSTPPPPVGGCRPELSLNRLRGQVGYAA